MKRFWGLDPRIASMMTESLVVACNPCAERMAPVTEFAPGETDCAVVAENMCCDAPPNQQDAEQVHSIGMCLRWNGN